MIARVLSSTQGANNTMMSTSLMTLPCTQECVIVKFHHIMNMHDQFRNEFSIKARRAAQVSSCQLVILQLSIKSYGKKAVVGS